ncbi:MAG TPA: sigma-70 family RNA polymerase sigma factor [Sporichthyaceae bacterium]|jgi:RNA polymerase sigma-70 factor (ECF subfamily)
MASELITKARAGDTDAFQQLVAPYRRELHVHCYRMLGSFHDAEDAVQDTLLAAWQHLAEFEARASVRTWLYRIATNRCLNALRAARRRPETEWTVPGVHPPQPSGLDEVVWLEPYPDALLSDRIEPGPEARYEQSEAISLAFITALQLLPARQRAVLILRDVLGYHADEVADLLGTSTESVTSALKRARATLSRHSHDPGEPAPAPESPAEAALVAAFVAAYQSSDIAGLVALMTDDVRVSMPPMPFVYSGRDLAGRFFAALAAGGRVYHLVPTRANGQLAFGAYLQSPTGGIRHGAGLLVLTVTGDRIAALTRFESGMLDAFGLPRALPC